SLRCGPEPVGVERALPVSSLVGVGPEEVTLRLNQVGGTPLAAIPVVIGECRAEDGQWNAARAACLHRLAPACLTRLERLTEEICQEQVGKVGPGRECRSNIVEERGADNTACPPYPGDFRKVKVIAVFF